MKPEKTLERVKTKADAKLKAEKWSDVEHESHANTFIPEYAMSFEQTAGYL